MTHHLHPNVTHDPPPTPYTTTSIAGEVLGKTRRQGKEKGAGATPAQARQRRNSNPAGQLVGGHSPPRKRTVDWSDRCPSLHLAGASWSTARSARAPLVKALVSAPVSRMRKLVEQGELDLDIKRDLFAQPVTLDEVLDTIDARIQRRLMLNPHPVYQSLAEQIERLRKQVIHRAEDSIDFLKQALEVARIAVQAERMEAEGRLDEAESLLDPHIGALTQIVNAYKPKGTPVIVDDVVRDIDSIVKQSRYTGWNETQEGDRTVRRELRMTLKKYVLPLTGPLFDNAYAYIRENY